MELGAAEAEYQSLEDFGFDLEERARGGIILSQILWFLKNGENFRMSKTYFYKLCKELRPFIERQSTNMRSPVVVERQVAATLYYLSDEGDYTRQPMHSDYRDLVFQ